MVTTLKPLIASFWLHCLLIVVILHDPSSYASFVNDVKHKERTPLQSAGLSYEPSSLSRFILPTPIMAKDTRAPSRHLGSAEKKEVEEPFSLFRQKLYDHWIYPEGMRLLRPAHFLLRLDANKAVLSLVLVQSSGNYQWDKQMYDRIIQVAVEAIPFHNRQFLLGIELDAMAIDFIEDFPIP